MASKKHQTQQFIHRHRPWAHRRCWGMLGDDAVAQWKKHLRQGGRSWLIMQHPQHPQRMEHPQLRRQINPKVVA
jgi:hypothetical protein